MGRGIKLLAGTYRTAFSWKQEGNGQIFIDEMQLLTVFYLRIYLLFSPIRNRISEKFFSFATFVKF
jgi:hypothetical protein